MFDDQKNPIGIELNRIVEKRKNSSTGTNWTLALEKLEKIKGKIWCVYFHQQIINGDVKDILKEKWSNVALVSALLLSISMACVLDPPNLGGDDSDFVVNLYGAFMSIASIFLFCAIYSVFQIYDAFRIHTVTNEDIILFILNHCYSIDIPQRCRYCKNH